MCYVERTRRASHVFVTHWWGMNARCKQQWYALRNGNLVQELSMDRVFFRECTSSCVSAPALYICLQLSDSSIPFYWPHVSIMYSRYLNPGVSLQDLEARLEECLSRFPPTVPLSFVDCGSGFNFLIEEPSALWSVLNALQQTCLDCTHGSYEEFMFHTTWN